MNAYLDDDNDDTASYADSPATTEDCDTMDDEQGVGVAGGGAKGRKRKRPLVTSVGQKVPRIKIRMIGRSRNNDSPIFTQSLEEVINMCGRVLIMLSHYPSNLVLLGGGVAEQRKVS